jgi:hypothetical protein
MAAVKDITLFIDPFSRHFLCDALFDLDSDRFGGDAILTPYVYLRSWFQDRGLQVYTADRLVRKEVCSAQNVYISFDIEDNCRALAKRGDVIPSAFFAFESPVVQPSLYQNLIWVQRYFKRIYSLIDSESLNPFLRGPLHCQQFRMPQSFDRVNEEVWRQTNRKFLVMINQNKLPRLYWRDLYTERLRALEFFSRTGDIDLYGIGWNVPPYRVGKTWMPYTLQRVHRKFLYYWQRIHPNPLLEAARRVYRGPALSKCQTLGQYKFALCFENTILEGWITEKIFDCFRAGTIPIYWGAPNIDTGIPAGCFIDMRHFESYQDLASYLKGLGEVEIQRYREGARDFLASEGFRPFTKETFVERIRRIIQEDTGIRIE